jgi:hypothetical protein
MDRGGHRAPPRLAPMTSVGAIQVWFDERREQGVLRRRLLFEGVDGESAPVESWWRLPAAAVNDAPPILDSLVFGHLLWAALLGQDLVVHGPMSHGGLYNIGRFLEIRRTLSPERYRRVIAVEPESVVRVARPPGDPQRAIAALSGGLDSTFTAVRHGLRLLGPASWPLDALVMVHGFDAPLDKPDLFDGMRRRTEPLMRRLGIPLHVVTTNSVATGGRAWPQAAIPLTAAVLSHFGDRHAVGLVSSSAPYGTPRFGITHPGVIDMLASNDWFRIVTDGGAYGRADKIEALAGFPDILAGIKVCWEGDDPSRNCGECEKCVMTRLSFLAAGMPDPPCFDTPLRLEHVARLDLRSVSAARDVFRFSWQELDRRGRTGPIVDLLRRRLSRVPPGERLPALRLRLLRLGARVIPASLRRRLRGGSARAR